MEKTSGAAVAVGSVGKQRSAIRSKKSGFTNVTERVMKYIFTVCGITAVACVLMITIYMIISGAPAIGKIGLTDFLFGDTWYAKKRTVRNTSADSHVGIRYSRCNSDRCSDRTSYSGVPVRACT